MLQAMASQVAAYQGLWASSSKAGFRVLQLASVRAASSSTAASPGPVPEIEPSALAQLLMAKTPGLVVLDVRVPEERASGHIPGSVNIPTPLFKQLEQQAELDAQIRTKLQGAQQVVVHCVFCSPGKRGPSCAATLAGRLPVLGMGGTRVSVLKGGIDAFMKAHGGDASLASLPPQGWKVEAH